MFTGLVDDVGTIDRVWDDAGGRTFAVRCRYEDLVPGESIALNGACLTVRDCAPRSFSVAAVVTTLGRTAMGTWKVGTRVNLERALRAGDRLGGHLVQGHVDGVATVVSVARREDALIIGIELPPALEELVVPHGSIAVDGVSLTVNGIPSPRVVELSIIEYTLRHTTLGNLAPGELVHVEADIIGKYVQSMLMAYRAPSPSPTPSWPSER